MVDEVDELDIVVGVSKRDNRTKNESTWGMQVYLDIASKGYPK